MSKKSSEKLTLKHIIGYGAGDCGGCIAMWMGWCYLTRFLQVHLQVNAAVLATMLLIWNVWDAVNDPMMGTIMDMAFAKAKPGKDKFRPWILASIPVLAIGSIGLFAVPQHLGGGWATVAAAFLLKHLRRLRLSQDRIFNSILTVQGVLRLIAIHFSLIGCFSSLVRLKHRLYFIGYFQKGIGFINIGIQIPKIDFLHYVPPFRFTGD